MAELVIVGTPVMVGVVVVLQLALVLTTGSPEVLQERSCANPPCVSPGAVEPS